MGEGNTIPTYGRIGGINWRRSSGGGTTMESDGTGGIGVSQLPGVQEEDHQHRAVALQNGR